MMFCTMLIAAALCARLFPDIPAGRWLHRALVEEPMRQLARLERRHVLFLLIGLVAIQGFALAMSMDMAVVLAWDVSLYADVALAVWSLAAVTRMRAGWTLLCAGLPGRRPRRLARPRRAGSGRRPRIRVAMNDEGEEGEARRAA